MRKLIGIFIFTLLIYAVLPVSANEAVNNKCNPTFLSNTLYVGGSGPGNYSKIQDAIDYASEGDTIFVFSGVYHEFIDVEWDKSINLIGENPASTIIDGPSDFESDMIVFIGADNVELSGFTIKSAKKIGSSGAVTCVCIFGDNVKVHSNIITGGWNGIMVDTSTGVHLFENTFTGNVVGCYLGWSVLTEVTENNFIDNNQNAKFRDSWSNFWFYNYWDDTHSKNFKIIFGWWSVGSYLPIFIPSINIDSNPAQEQFDI